MHGEDPESPISEKQENEEDSMNEESREEYDWYGKNGERKERDIDTNIAKKDTLYGKASDNSTDSSSPSPGALYEYMEQCSTLQGGLSYLWGPQTPGVVFMENVAEENSTASQFAVGIRDRNMTVCSLSTTRIDMKVECTRSLPGREISCSARSARHSKGFPLTAEEKLYQNSTVVSRFFTSIPNLAPSPYSRPLTPSPMEEFLADPLIGADYDTSLDQQYMALPPDIFEARLANVLNTVMRGSYETTITVGRDRSGYLYHQKDFGERRLPEYGKMTGVGSSWSPPMYRLDKGWFTVYILSTVILFVCVMITVYLRAMIRVPDFLNNISALARDSFYVQMPVGGTFLDGMQMTRRIGKKRVKIGDVSSNDQIGRIAFADEENVRSGPLCVGRLYE